MRRTAGRESEPLMVHLATAQGEERLPARAVLDASGTWASPAPPVASGMSFLADDPWAYRAAARKAFRTR